VADVPPSGSGEPEGKIETSSDPIGPAGEIKRPAGKIDQPVDFAYDHDEVLEISQPNDGPGFEVTQLWNEAGKIDQPADSKASTPDETSVLVGKMDPSTSELAHFRPSLSTTEQVSPVHVRGYDPAAHEKPITGGAVGQSSLVGKFDHLYSAPVGKISIPVAAAKTPSSRRGYLAVAALIGVTLVAVLVLNGAFSSVFPTSAPASPTNLIGAATATSAPPTGATKDSPSPPPTNGSPLLPPTTGSPSPPSSGGVVVPSPVDSGYLPPPTATQPSSSIKPTAAPTDTPAVVNPTPTPKPTPTKFVPTPSPKPTPTLKPTDPPPIIALVVTPKSVDGSCKGGVLAPFDAQLDNSASTVAVHWSIKFNSSSLSGSWGAASPQSGDVDAGAVGKTTITPSADICSIIKPEDFVLEVSYGADFPQTVTFHYSP
jgi:hypothetical protein